MYGLSDAARLLRGAKKLILTNKKRPLSIALMPVANKTRDLSAPILVRYFLDKKLDRRWGIDLPMSPVETDQLLRAWGSPMGIRRKR